MSFELIDVTLRDGGYRNRFNYSIDALKTLLPLVDASGVDYIEIGYRNGSFAPIANIGPAGLCQAAYLKLCRGWIKKAKMTVMMHPRNVNEADVDEMIDAGVDYFRVCIARADFDKQCQFIKLLQNKNISFAVNITRVTQYSEDELRSRVHALKKMGCNTIYFADSNGSMLPQKVKSLFLYFSNKYQGTWGFHAHDNLGLAQANAIAAMKGGACMIDASLFGTGKGVGNLNEELYVSYLIKTKIKRLSLENTVAAANYVRNELRRNDVSISMNHLKMGILDLSITDVETKNKLCV